MGVARHGVGAEIIIPMAVPVLGGLLISDEVGEIFLPVHYGLPPRGAV
jgi:Cu(I)/Ag(I) efflux system membrane protein CusA/SilA